MQLNKGAMRLLVIAACAVLAAGCAMQATTASEDAAKTTSSQAVSSDSGSGGTSVGSAGAQGGADSGRGGVSGSGFSEQAVVEGGTDGGAATDASGTAGAMGAAGMASTMDTMAGLMRIHFDFDRYELSEAARMTLAANAAYLQANPQTQIRIEGHCDERGSDEYNLALGEQRAMAAKRYLQSLGVDTSRMTIISYGEERPLDEGNNEEAWAKNRRAEFISQLKR